MQVEPLLTTSQAARLLAYGKPQTQQAPSSRPAPTASAPPQHQSYLNKPPPPLPQEHNQHGYRPHSGSNARISPVQNPPSTSPYQAPAPQNYAPSTQPPPSQNYGPSPQPPQPQNYAHSPPQPPGAYLQHSQSYTGYAPPQPIRSPTPSRPPIPSVGSSDASLFPLFKAVDATGTGQLSEQELRSALVNGDFQPFDLQTVRMMIRMFDHDRSGTVGFDEFW